MILVFSCIITVFIAHLMFLLFCFMFLVRSPCVPLCRSLCF